jgi:PAS domain S-box-containing protein
MEQAVRLLVADDDEVDRLALRRTLRQAGMEVRLVEVTDGAAALAALLAQPFDCALIDFRMPSLDGLEVLRQARAALVETPIIVLTGQGDEQIAVELMKAGATDYLTKSALSAELLTRGLRQARRLHEAERQHRFLAELLPHIVWAAREDGHVDYYNRRWFEYTGRPPEQPLAWHEATHPEDLPEALGRCAERMQAGEPFEAELRLQRADGAWRWHLSRALPMRNGQGRVVRWFGTVFDIDDQKRAGERAERLQAATAALSKALTSQQVAEVLAAFATPPPRSEAEQAFSLALEREGAQALERARLYEAAHKARAEAEASEARLRALLEEHRRMESALKERDERLRAALSASGTGTFRWDLRTHALEWDENLVRLHGLPPGQTVLTFDDFLERVHPEDQQGVLERCAQCVNEGADLDIDYRALWPDGSVRWLTAKGRTLLDADGRPLYMTGACVDLTAQKQQEAEVRQRAEFERQLLGIVSHDLRHPLGTIQLSASMLLSREGIDERQIRGLTRILTASARSTRLIKDLLDFSQARLGGGIPIQRRPVDLFSLARVVVEELSANHSERRLELLQEGEGEGAWDEDRLMQVLGNLVGNALQHSPPDSPVQVRCRGEPEEVSIEVRNQGAPISPALLPHLFEPFRRGSQAGSGTGSVGLGLYITRQLVLAHGGTLSVSSTTEEGTCFTVRLPRRGETPPSARPEVGET